MLLYLKRKNKSLILTAEGKVLLDCCQHVFNQLDHCVISIKQQKYKSNNLIISCEPTISMKWLIPRMVSFNELNLGFAITLLTGGGPLDFQNQDIDLAIEEMILLGVIIFSVPKSLMNLCLW